MSPLVFIFIGRSGCGKGTQAQLLKAVLEKQDPKRTIINLETGKIFREFIKGDTYTQKESKAIYDAGGLQPEFLTIAMWSGFLVREMRPDVHVVIDGTPRKYAECFALDSAVKFYRWPKPHVIYLNISREEATRRLLVRKRIDDNVSDIASRLDWFEEHVARALTFYRSNPDYFYHDIAAEQPPEVVHQEILQRTGLVR